MDLFGHGLAERYAMVCGQVGAILFECFLKELHCE